MALAIQNPVDRYPKPSFKKQSQPWQLDLASKMEPPFLITARRPIAAPDD